MSSAADAIEYAIAFLRDIKRSTPEVLKSSDIDAFILNELNPALVAARNAAEDAYAMATVRRLGLCIAHNRNAVRIGKPEREWAVQNDTYSEMVERPNLNMAIAELAAKIEQVQSTQSTKKGS